MEISLSSWSGICLKDCGPVWKWWWAFRVTQCSKSLSDPCFIVGSLPGYLIPCSKIRLGLQNSVFISRTHVLILLICIDYRRKFLYQFVKASTGLSIGFWDLPHPQWHRFVLSLVFQPPSSFHAHSSLPYLFLITFRLKTLSGFFLI